jgi:hypothetical protein
MAFEIERPVEIIPTPQQPFDVRLLMRGVVSMFRSPTAQVADVEDGTVYCVQGWEAPDQGGRALRVFWDRDDWQPKVPIQEQLKRSIGLHVQEVSQVVIGDNQGVATPHTRHYAFAHNPFGTSYGLQTEFLTETFRSPDSYVTLPFRFQAVDSFGSLQPIVSLAYLATHGVDTDDQHEIDDFTELAFSSLSHEEYGDLDVRLFAARRNGTPGN